MNAQSTENAAGRNRPTMALELAHICHNYRKTAALKDVSLVVAPGSSVALIGPDGAGKSTLLGVCVGVKKLQRGSARCMGLNPGGKRDRTLLAYRVSYMPQGLGRNLYPTLSVYENIEFFANLFGIKGKRKEEKITELLQATSMDAFRDRPAGKLSGGMKQKLSLCCSLINDPDILILDEPTTGVDPLSRLQFWMLIDNIKKRRQGMTVVVATAYMDEAMRFANVVAMNEGRIIASGKREDILRKTGKEDLDGAFVALMEAQKKGISFEQNDLKEKAQNSAPSEGGFAALDGVGRDEPNGAETADPFADNAEAQTAQQQTAAQPARAPGGAGAQATEAGAEAEESVASSNAEAHGQEDSDLNPTTRDKRDKASLQNRQPIIVARNLTKKFGDFTAVRNVSFSIPEGEIFGFLGSNGCGKSTTMKMLTGLLEPTSGYAEVMGKPVSESDQSAKLNVGYMSQAFSLYEEITVEQNLRLHAQLFRMGRQKGEERIAELLDRFDLRDVKDEKPTALPLGVRQRLQLAVALLHSPKLLILDEPTSGVDPEARDEFWGYLINISRHDKVTIFVTTHFMNEALRCDRISFMHKGMVLAVGTPEELRVAKKAPTLEQAFIDYISESERDSQSRETPAQEKVGESRQAASQPRDDERRSRRPDELGADGETAASGATGSAVSVPKLAFFQMVFAFARREMIELFRDRIRMFFAVVGPSILIIVCSLCFSLDIKEVRYAAMDLDNTSQSRRLLDSFNGIEAFQKQPDAKSLAELEDRIRTSDLHFAIVIPENFGRDLLRGSSPTVSMYVDGNSTFVADNAMGYAQSAVMRFAQDHMIRTALVSGQGGAEPITPLDLFETRYMYNPELKSIDVVSPGMLTLYMLLIPAMLTALGVVREKEIGSIHNFYRSPATSAEFLIGKQLPYIVLSLFSAVLLFLEMTLGLGVPFKGNALSFFTAALAYFAVGTATGLVMSSVLRTQLAALIATTLFTMLPAINFSGLYSPMSAMPPGVIAFARLFPAGWFQFISQGSFAKGIGWAQTWQFVWPMLLILSAYLIIASLALKKQEP